MFDFVRKHTRIMQFMLFLLIFPSFVMFGLDGYNRFREKGEVVARVDGQDIGQAEWDNAHKNQVDTLRGRAPNMDLKLLESPAARFGTLESLIREKVIAAASAQAHLLVTDQRLARELQDNPVIASLRRSDGSLDMDRYRELVGSQGLSPEMFEARTRADMAARQVMAGITASGFAPPGLAASTLNAMFERREVQVVYFKTADYLNRVNPSDAELEADYRSHPEQFQAPESANIEYIVLDIDALRQGIAVNEADLRSYYEQNLPRMGGKEERRASHILIKAGKDASDPQRQQARQRAQTLLDQVRKAPASFAELARKNSQDEGSASRGGDLDFFARGAMVKPFEDAAFALKKGEISGLVESDFGFHIIQVTDIKGDKPKSFEEMRASLEMEWRRQQAQRKFAEAAEVFSNGVYEQSDSLKPVADRLHLEIRTATGLQRQAAAGSKGVLAHPKFLAALFSTDALQKKINTEAIETGPQQLVAGRVLQHKPAQTLPFEQVRGDVRKRVVSLQAAALARKEGQAQLAAWKEKPEVAHLPAPITVSRDQPLSLSRAVLDASLLANSGALPNWGGLDLAGEGYAVVHVLKRLDRDPPDAVRAQREREQFAQWLLAAEEQAYYQFLKDRFKVQIKVSKPMPEASALDTQS